ncbi:hypothetical protein [Virgibacillus halodenitrificans]|uniref:hypothetical protein n=1 Tax=Virgibacillus halodenitrificans TaxID=1482 RepID=UPI000EF47891|nr:hypothetical protein [Virgibacillus halodenitrificans]
MKHTNESNTKKNYIDKRTKTAKLDRELFFCIGNGTLPITGSAINFMLYTINFVAKDGRIYCANSKMLKDLCMQHKTLNRVIGELKLLNLLSEKNGFLYSHFHVLSSGDKGDKGYIQNIHTLNSNDIFALNIKKKRFFIYVCSFARMGIPKSVSVEALYSNKYHSGVNYIENYQELSEILFEFVQKGYFVVYINGNRYDKDSSNFEEVFHSFCGYDSLNGKQRMSKIEKHKIGLQIHENLTERIQPNQSSKEEFKYYANQYHIYHELMRPETIPFFINIQNELFDLFGTVGVDLYRHALISYFSAEEDNVLYHDLISNKNETKAVNTLVDFYLIKDVQDVIVNVLAKEKTDESIIQYFMNESYLSKLVQYFVQKSSDNQKILLDAALDAQGIQLNELVEMVPNDNIMDNHWLLLQNHISNIYEHILLKNVDKRNQQLIVRDWAEKGILAKKEWIRQAAEQLKNRIAPFDNRESIDITFVGGCDNSNQTSKGSKETYVERRRKLREERTKRAIEAVKNTDDISVNF